MASSLHVTAASGDDTLPSRFSATDALLLCMALFWGLNFIVVKFATGVFAPLAFNTARILLAVAVLWAIVLGSRRALPSLRDLLALLALGVLGNGLYQFLFVDGIARTRASDAALLLAASPAVIEIIGWARGLEQRAGPRGVAGIGLSLAGIAMVVAGNGHGAGASSLVGNMLMLGACVAWSLYSVLLKPFTDRVDGVTLSAVTMTGGVSVMLVVSAGALRGTDWTAVSTAGWGALVYSGLVALVIAYLFWYRGVRVLGPTRASMYANVQPLFAMLAAWYFLQETPGLPQAIGAVCILGGLLLTRLPVNVRSERI